MTELLPTYADVQAAAARIQDAAHRTPVLTSRTLNERLGATLYLKCENFQRVGAFKFRGAFNAVACLSDEVAARGVVAHSSGNHAQALALAARVRGIPAYLVIPEDAPAVKLAAVRGYGAEVTLCAPTLAARETTCDKVIARTGATLIHAYDHPDVIAGQGTACLELLEEVPDLDMVVAPVGGGGLMSGTCLAAKGRKGQDFSVWGAEPLEADDAARSLALGSPQPPCPPTTVADGLRTALSDRTYAILYRDLEGIGTCSEDSIREWTAWIWQRLKIVIEPSSAVPLACMGEGAIPVAGKRVGVILSGGNTALVGDGW